MEIGKIIADKREMRQLLLHYILEVVKLCHCCWSKRDHKMALLISYSTKIELVANGNSEEIRRRKKNGDGEIKVFVGLN